MMAYKNNFAVAIKHNGKVLREVSDLVYLPFGSDYSILLKNMDSRKAVVDIEIDGQDVLDGNSIIVPSNRSVELKGFMKGSSVKNKFRFIKKTRKISNYRGDRIDDSLVRVEYRFEKLPTPTYDIVYYRTSPMFNYSSLECTSKYSYNTCCKNSTSYDDIGITVPGAKTSQNFEQGYTNELECSSSVIVLKLVGVKPNNTKGQIMADTLVKKPLTVKTKKICKTCGTKSKFSAKYCRECGTFLN